MVSPSAAVTVTTKLFSPTIKLWSPSITKVASGSAVSTSTSTSVVPTGRTRTPSAGSMPSIVMEFTEASAERGTYRSTTYSAVSTSFSAVTVITRSFEPWIRLSAPVTSKVALGSVVSTLTSTASVFGASMTWSPS